jgi:hypothetical protein
MGTELVPEMLYSNEVTRLCARENYIESCRRESFKTYIKNPNHRHHKKLPNFISDNLILSSVKSVIDLLMSYHFQTSCFSLPLTTLCPEHISFPYHAVFGGILEVSRLQMSLRHSETNVHPF